MRFLRPEITFFFVFKLWNALRCLLDKAIIDPTCVETRFGGTLLDSRGYTVLKCFHKGIVVTLAK